MELELSKETMARLAKEIARAQLTAADEFVDEAIKDWPEDFKRKVGEVGQLTLDGQGNVRVLSAQDRYAAYRSERIGAERAIERAKREQEETEAVIKRSKEAHEQSIQETIARNKAGYDADMARWKAETVIAEQSGRHQPPEPNRENYALTEDEVMRADSAAYIHTVF